MTACPKCGAGGLENLQKAIKIIMNNDPIPEYQGKRPREVPFKNQNGSIYLPETQHPA